MHNYFRNLKNMKSEIGKSEMGKQNKEIRKGKAESRKQKCEIGNQKC
jgi:hypothetical protein